MSKGWGTGVLTNEGLELESSGSWGWRPRLARSHQQPLMTVPGSWGGGMVLGAEGGQMTRSKMMVTGSYPTHSEPKGGCLLLGNSRVQSVPSSGRHLGGQVGLPLELAEGIWWVV